MWACVADFAISDRLRVGIDNLDILRTHTYGHHWKEYSKKELCHYFCALSDDFHVNRALEVTADFRYPSSLMTRKIAFLLP